MYSKIFRSIYDGSLADDWQALVTFQQFLILADADGVIDMTLAAIHRVTGIPTEILVAGIASLELPDEHSRSPEMQGRRVSKLESHRDWGWFIVNWRKYRDLKSRDEKRDADRTRIAARRQAAKATPKSQGVAARRGVSLEVAKVAHTNTNTNTNAKTNTSRAHGQGKPSLQGREVGGNWEGAA